MTSHLCRHSFELGVRSARAKHGPSPSTERSTQIEPVLTSISEVVGKKNGSMYS